MENTCALNVRDKTLKIGDQSSSWGTQSAVVIGDKPFSEKPKTFLCTCIIVDALCNRVAISPDCFLPCHEDSYQTWVQPGFKDIHVGIRSWKARQGVPRLLVVEGDMYAHTMAHGINRYINLSVNASKQNFKYTILGWYAAECTTSVTRIPGYSDHMTEIGFSWWNGEFRRSKYLVQAVCKSDNGRQLE